MARIPQGNEKEKEDQYPVSVENPASEENVEKSTRFNVLGDAIALLILIALPLAMFFVLGSPQLALPSEWTDVQGRIADGTLPSANIVDIVAGVLAVAWLGALISLIVSVMSRTRRRRAKVSRGGSRRGGEKSQLDTLEAFPGGGAESLGEEDAEVPWYRQSPPIFNEPVSDFQTQVIVTSSEAEDVPEYQTIHQVAADDPFGGGGSPVETPSYAAQAEPQEQPTLHETPVVGYGGVEDQGWQTSAETFPPAEPAGAYPPAGAAGTFPPAGAYEDTQVSAGVISHESARSPSVEAPEIIPVRAYYISRNDDTLRSISAQFLNSPARWEELRTLNAAYPSIASLGADDLVPLGSALMLPGDPMPWGKPDPVSLWTSVERFLYAAWGREPAPAEVVPFWKGLAHGAELEAGALPDMEGLPGLGAGQALTTEPGPQPPTAEAPEPPLGREPETPSYEPQPSAGVAAPAGAAGAQAAPAGAAGAQAAPAGAPVQEPAHAPGAPAFPDEQAPASPEIPGAADEAPAAPAAYEPPPSTETLPPDAYETPAPGAYEMPPAPPETPAPLAGEPSAPPAYDAPPAAAPETPAPPAYEPPAPPAYEPPPAPPAYDAPPAAYDTPAAPGAYDTPTPHAYEPPSTEAPPPAAYEPPFPGAYEPPAPPDAPAPSAYEPPAAPSAYDTPTPHAYEPPPLAPPEDFEEQEAPPLPTFMPSMTGADPSTRISEQNIIASRRSLAGTAIGDAMLLWQLSRIRRRRGDSGTQTLDPLEESLRQSARMDSLRLIEAAMRHLRAVTVAQLRRKPKVVAVRVGAYGFEVLLDQPTEAPDYWVAASGGYVLELAEGVTIEHLDSFAQGPSLCPALIPVGDTLEGPLLLNFEEIGCLTISGPEAQSNALLSAIVEALGSSPMAESVRVIALGVDTPQGPGWERVMSTSFDSPHLEQLLVRASKSEPLGGDAELDVLVVGQGHDILIQRAGQIATTPGSNLALVGATSSAPTRWPWRIHIDATSRAVVQPIAFTMLAAQAVAPDIAASLMASPSETPNYPPGY